LGNQNESNLYELKKVENKFGKVISITYLCIIKSKSIMETTKKAYAEILKVLKKHKDICIFDIEDLERKAKIHLFGLQLKEEYGLDIDPKCIYDLHYQRFGNFMVIDWFGEKYRKTISWSDDGRQPDDELLLKIGFSTGAYIFGEDYPTDLFQKFFLELKSYNPKYIDSHNSSLYFSMDNAKEIFNKFNDILLKYKKINEEDYKRRQIEELKKQLENLQK